MEPRTVISVHTPCPLDRARSARHRAVIAAASVWALSFAAVACGDNHGALDAGVSRPDATSPVDAPPECQQSVGAFVAEHACLHAIHGPFEAIMAGVSAIAPAADVSQPHTAFRVKLPARDGDNEGALRYVPRRSGAFAMFSAPAIAMKVLDANGQQIPASLAHAVFACGELGTVTTFALDQGSAYSLVLSSATAADALLVIEALDEFLPSEAYQTTCELPDAGLGDAAPPPRVDAALPDAAIADAAPGPDADCAPRLGPVVVEHACLHVMHGPFGTVTAQPDPATATVNINASHTYYTVESFPSMAFTQAW